MKHWTDQDIPDQTGRTAIVTGANTGVGFETASALAARGALVVLAVRDLDKGQVAANRIVTRHPGARLALQQLDLGSLASVASAAAQLRADHAHIDLLINNAGVMDTPKSTTADGFELQFGTNHLGHFAFTARLIDRLLATPGSRVVTLSSVTQRSGRINFEDLQSEHYYDKRAAYGQSKLANLLFAYELQRRLVGTDTLSVAAHPGGAITELARHQSTFTQLKYRIMSQDAAHGAWPTLRAATDPSVSGGQFYGPDGLLGLKGYPVPCPSSARSHDPDVAQRLWSISEKLTRTYFHLQVDMSRWTW